MTAECRVGATRPPLLADEPPAALSISINSPQEVAPVTVARATESETVGVRFPAHEKAALMRAAAADDRTVAQLVRKTVREHLRQAGYLEASERSA